MLSAEAKADLEKFDAAFEKWRRKNGGGMFSAFSTARIKASIEKGRPHTTLGPNLTGADGWWKDGLWPAELIYQQPDITENTTICDYGCGSLRVGAHIMSRQAPGCYYGIDVVEDFIDIGRKIAGEALLGEKRPVLGAIDAKLGETIAAGVDITFAFNVAPHIHPDEQAGFNSNLKSICRKPGSRLLLHTINYPEALRFQRSGWAYPAEQYIAWMRPLSLLSVALIKKSVVKNGVDLRSYMFVFTRD